MNKNQEFDLRIAEVHYLGQHGRGHMHSKVAKIDVRHEEFRAMADAFLGEDYPKDRLAQVEELQMTLHAEQDHLSKKYREGDLTPSEFVDAQNALSERIFTECARILGSKDFEELFGAPLSEGLWRVDKESFLHSLQH